MADLLFLIDLLQLGKSWQLLETYVKVKYYHPWTVDTPGLVFTLGQKIMIFLGWDFSSFTSEIDQS